MSRREGEGAYRQRCVLRRLSARSGFLAPTRGERATRATDPADGSPGNQADSRVSGEWRLCRVIREVGGRILGQRSV